MSGSLTWLSESSVAAESAANWATATGFAMAIVVGISAVVRYILDIRRSNVSYADVKYESFIDCAIANPVYAYNFWESSDQRDRVKLGGYLYFIAKALWSCEEILKCPGHEDWTQTIYEVLSDHRSYLMSDDFSAHKNSYHPRLLEIIDRVIAERSGVNNA